MTLSLQDGQTTQGFPYWVTLIRKAPEAKGICSFHHASCSGNQGQIKFKPMFRWTLFCAPSARFSAYEALWPCAWSLISGQLMGITTISEAEAKFSTNITVNSHRITSVENLAYVYMYVYNSHYFMRSIIKMTIKVEMTIKVSSLHYYFFGRVMILD